MLFALGRGSGRLRDSGGGIVVGAVASIGPAAGPSGSRAASGPLVVPREPFTTSYAPPYRYPFVSLVTLHPPHLHM